jgi:hypothetical protein
MSYNQPFAEQLAFFRQKLNLPTEAWDDITLAAHDRAFVVAGAQGADLLADLRDAMDAAIENGTGLEQFRKDFARIVAQNGWTGWTGEGTPGGVAWRTKVIYQTNMATSYAAGRFKQLSDPDLLKILPYWQYHHNDSVMHPRPLHVSWDGLTLPPDHPFWETHFPPNGWGCQCWVSAVSQDDFMAAIAAGRGPADAPDGTAGIDLGFGYAPGASLSQNNDTGSGEQQALQDFAAQKIDTLPPEIGGDLLQSLVGIIKVALLNELLKKIAERKAAQPDVKPQPDASFAGFDPGQPRVDAGNPDGGEWTAEGGAAQAVVPKVQEGHHTLDKAVAIENSALVEARSTASYDIKELSSTQIQSLRDNRGGGTYTWLPKSQVSTHDGHVIGMQRWLADKQGMATKEGTAARAAAFDSGKARYDTLLAQAKAGGVKGVRVGMRTSTIKEKMKAHGMAVEFADDDEGLDFMAGIDDSIFLRARRAIRRMF